MAIDSKRTLRPVTGDVVGVASTAPASPLRINTKIVSTQGMLAMTMGLSRHRVNTVTNLVERILGMRSVLKVRGDVVGLVAVDVSSDQAFRAGAVKGQSHQVMNLEAPLPPVITVDGDVRVPLVVRLGLQDAALGSRSWNRPDMASHYRPVVAEPRNERISAIHDYDYTEGAVA